MSEKIKGDRGVRSLLIIGMEREKLIEFIKRKDAFYSNASFEGHSTDQLRKLALCLDKELYTRKNRK